MKYKLPDNLKSKIIYKFDLSKLTWFKTGGLADVFCHVYDVEELKIILKNTSSDTPIFILGSGSNILVRDGGFKGMVIKLGKGFNDLLIKNDKLLVGASILDVNLSKFALENSISNFEFYTGIPGTIGGAIKMNAGCYGCETKNVVHGVNVIDRIGNEQYLDLNKLQFKYRSSSIDDHTFVKNVIFKIKREDINVIKNKMKKIINERNLSQPLRSKTSGSTFKNPKGLIAAKLIEECGCKDIKVGNASVSEKHANFIINNGGSSSKDIETLGKLIQERVYNKFNLSLEWEIKIIGVNV